MDTASKADQAKRAKTILHLIGLLFVVQLCLIAVKHTIFRFVTRTNFTDRMASFAGMVLLTGIGLLIARKKKIPLSVFPKHFSAFYIVATVLAALLLVSTPILTKETGITALAYLVYGSVITPVFEELIFRGYVWNQLNTVFRKEWVTYIVDTILFGLWHIGYVDAIAFRVDSGLATAMFWKGITGLCFGLVLGAVRLKTKNSYSTMLLHGVMNLFGR